MAPAKPMIRANTQNITITIGNKTADQMAYFFASSAAFRAPSVSPKSHSSLTLVDLMIETTPRGIQQKHVVNIAQTKWFSGGGPNGF